MVCTLLQASGLAGQLKYGADQAGVKAQAYFDLGTPESVFIIARRQLGAENVFAVSWNVNLGLAKPKHGATISQVVDDGNPSVPVQPRFLLGNLFGSGN
jgi:hypothetical protein